MQSSISLFVLAVSVLLSGCCSSVKPDGFDRFEMAEYKPGPTCGIFSGWGTTSMPERAQAFYTPVAPTEYGEILCENRTPEDYATCVNQVVGYLRAGGDTSAEGASATSGPFAVVMDDRLYLGSYQTDLFSGYFRAASGIKSCTGSYNAFFGANSPVFKVTCDDGRTGTADIVRDRAGRSGIGYVAMNDGTKGKIVFGPAAGAATRIGYKR
jgi:hypothetical protein